MPIFYSLHLPVSSVLQQMCLELTKSSMTLCPHEYGFVPAWWPTWYFSSVFVLNSFPQ